MHAVEQASFALPKNCISLQIATKQSALKEGQLGTCTNFVAPAENPGKQVAATTYVHMAVKEQAHAAKAGVQFL